MKTIYLRQQEQYSPWGQRTVVVLSLIFTLIVSALLAANVWGLDTEGADIAGDLTVTGTVTIGGTEDPKTIINNDGTTQLADNVTILGQLRTPHQEGKKQTNGYTVLPSGVYIQWGINITDKFGKTYDFPIEFPNAAWVIVGMRNNQLNHGLLVKATGKKTFYLEVEDGSPYINWIAIGY